MQRKIYNSSHKRNYSALKKPIKQPKNKNIKKPINDNFNFIMAGRDFNKLTPAEKLVFFLAFSSAAHIVLANPEPAHYHNDNYYSNSSMSCPTLFGANKGNTTLSFSNSPLVNNDSNIITSYKNNSVEALSKDAIKNCVPKNVGVNGGKKCEIKIKGKSSVYMLKVVDTNENSYESTSNALLTEYNSRILKNLNVRTPYMQFFFEKEGTYIKSSGETAIAELYHGSEFVNDFQSFSAFIGEIKTNPIYKEMNPNLSRKQITHIELIKKIGEKGIASLAVASTLINDLIGNPDNWGISEGQLIIIDMDNSPKSYTDYYDTGTFMPTFFEDEGILFSKETIKEMLDIYQDMLNKPVPTLHSEVNISLDLYKFLLNKYITACKNTLSDLKNKYTNEESINNLLLKNIKIQLHDLVNNIKPKL